MQIRNVIGTLGRALGLACGLALVSAGAGAQTTTGTIRGYVTSAGSTPVSDAQIAARNTENNQTRGTLTNASGFYYLGGLRPGRYELQLRRVGFAPQTRTIDVLIGQTLDINFQVAEAAVQLSAVEVVAAPEATTETRTSEVATNVTRQQIENLPSRDRNFLDLAKLAPGVAAQQPGNSDKKISAGAQPADNVNVFVDGASYKNDVLQGGVAGQDASRGNPFPQNAVQEFRIITQNYKAEYQKASSAIITATTKSGGNAWEGNVFAYGIGRGYAGRDPIAVRDNLPKPNFRRLQAGISAGGPVQRDRLFFFGTYEVNFEDSPADVRVGGDVALAPVGLNPQQYAGRFTTEFRQHLGFGKLTFTPSERNSFDVSANIRHETDVRNFGGQTSFQSAENVKQDIYTGTATWRYAGNRWLNEAQISGQHYRWNPTPEDDQTIGRNYFGIIRIGGRDTEQRFTQNRISLRNDVTRAGVQLAGDHVFKGGASVDLLKYEGVKYFVSNPVFNFRREENYLRPFEAQFGFGDPNVSANNTQVGAYVQDDWTISRRLVLNLGVRWDVETNMINNDYVTPQQIRDSLSGPLRSRLFNVRPRPGVAGRSDTVRIVDALGGLENYFTSGSDDRPPFWGAFQPRVGASYDLSGDGRTVVFGGFGVYYDRNYWNQNFDEFFRRQFKVLRIQFDTLGPRAGCRQCVKWDPKYFDVDQLRTLAASGQAGVPEVFLIANDTKPPKTNQFSAGVRQTLGPALVTLSYNGTRSTNGFAFVRGTPCCGGLQPTYDNLLISTDEVKTWYDAVQLQVDKPLRQDTRWGGGLSYTYAFTTEQQGEYFFSLDSRYTRPSEYPRRRSPNSQEHTIVANGLVRLPWDVLFSTLINLGSGFAQLADDQTLGTSDQFRQTYVFEPETRAFLGLGHVFNQQNMDVRLEKRFGFASGQKLGVLVDVFNVLNSRNFGCYDARIAQTGQTNANYGRPNCSQPGRRLQVGLTYDLSPSSLGRGR
ncbi:MAG: TonB-dependent receptor [Gemmatimonadaceae bacterium]